MLYPCPACGFEVFQNSIGSYDMCPLCGWEDDGVQLKFPAMRGGANGESLYERQQKNLEEIPLELKELNGFFRDKTWRPLTLEECQNVKGMPKTGFEYFLSIDGKDDFYYWRK